MKKLLIALMILVVAACSSNQESNSNEVKVKEVLQAGEYTYLLVKGNGPEHWVAVPSMEAKVGETYYYQGGLLMTDFKSDALNQTFETVLFLEALSTEPIPEVAEVLPEVDYGNMVTIEKADVNIEPVEGTISISELFSNVQSYDGKTVRIKGEVTKFNPSIMDRNWVHLQDGTEFEGKFDLTATTLQSFEVGETVLIEGTVALNKDFGYGYSYEILLENAKELR